MSRYDTDYLIAQVKRRASLPTSQNLFTDAKLILMLDDELKTRVVPFLMSFHDNWFAAHKTYNGDNSTVSFAIPQDAVGQKLKDVSIWNNGTPRYSNYPRVEFQDLAYVSHGYYIEGNNIIFYPSNNAPNTGDVVDLTYYKRVSDLVATSEAREISLIAGANVDSATTLPATFVTGADVQIVSHNSPFNVLWTGSISNVSGNTVTLDSTPTNISVGDWLCLEDQTVFAQIPIECIPVLCQAVVIRCMESMNDREGLQNAVANFEQIKQSAIVTISPKVDSSPNKVMTGKTIARFL